MSDDAFMKRIGYRDETQIHEVVDLGRPLPALFRLEKSFRDAPRIDHYITPSVNPYRELIQTGWNDNTQDQDHENALAAAAFANDVASVSLLLQHGAAVSPHALEIRGRGRSPDLCGWNRQRAARKRLA